jgi:hypothetical protein
MTTSSATSRGLFGKDFSPLAIEPSPRFVVRLVHMHDRGGKHRRARLVFPASRAPQIRRFDARSVVAG